MGVLWEEFRTESFPPNEEGQCLQSHFAKKKPHKFLTGFYENFYFSSSTFSFIITITIIESPWTNPNKLAQDSLLSPPGAQSSY